jgi:hypothetical protein
MIDAKRVWVVDANLRQECRAAISAKIDNFQPDIICAHSLGTLLCYDLFTFDAVGGQKINGRTFISFGSQIGNTFVKDKAWAGRVRMIGAKQWYHLFNHQDPAFTAEIQEPRSCEFFGSRHGFTGRPFCHCPRHQFRIDCA